MEAVLFVGIQGSGKTTFYREKFFETHVRISLDMLKTRHRQNVLLSACLAAGQPFVVDDTSATKARRAELIAAARAAGFRVAGYYFRTTLGDAIRRNKSRARVVPAGGVGATYKRLEPPSRPEGFDDLRVVEILPGGGFAVSDWPGEDPPPKP
ncbi:MAG TPA: AAA family ATPase [Thermoanaerobaculia bacterium]|nr:AAA family ATPase [Thermoanaerobaculia bacterium]